MKLTVTCNGCRQIAFEARGKSPLRIEEKYPFYCATCDEMLTGKYPYVIEVTECES